MDLQDKNRSLWAWGDDSKRPDTDALRALVQGFLGVDVGNATTAVSLDEINLQESRITIPASLLSFCSSGRRERAIHTHGKGFRDQVRAFRGDFSSAPDLVAYPKTEEEVEAVLAWAETQEVAVIPFGGGTSVVGGIEVPGGERRAISLDLRGMDRVLEVDTENQSARIQAGVLGPSLERQLASYGYTLRHYPQSFEFSSLGGWIATRAGGHFATLYTHIDEFVQSLRVVTPRGQMVTPRVPASGAGPSPDRLILGSEGIFGVITEAWMRVRLRPRYRASASVNFSSFEGAVGAARVVAQSHLYPSNCRLLDPVEAMMNAVSSGGDSVLLLGFESADHTPAEQLQRAVALVLEQGGVLSRPPTVRDDGPSAQERGGDASAEAWRQAFFDGPYRQSALISLGVLADTFETCCTWSAFPRLHAALQEAAQATFARIGARGVLSCRFTHVYPDGPAPYYTFVAAGFSVDLLDAWREVKQAMSDVLRAHGATITHHHSIGKLHRYWYDQERPELFAATLRGAKAIMDPAGIMNPGVLID